MNYKQIKAGDLVILSDKQKNLVLNLREFPSDFPDRNVSPDVLSNYIVEHSTRPSPRKIFITASMPPIMYIGLRYIPAVSRPNNDWDNDEPKGWPPYTFFMFLHEGIVYYHPKRTDEAKDFLTVGNVFAWPQ